MNWLGGAENASAPEPNASGRNTQRKLSDRDGLETNSNDGFCVRVRMVVCGLGLLAHVHVSRPV